MPVPFGRTSTQSYLAFFIGVLSLTGRCVPSNPPYTPRARIGSPRPPLARDTAHEGSRSAPHAPAQVHALPARSGRTSEGPERTRRAIRTELPPRHTTTPPSDAADTVFTRTSTHLRLFFGGALGPSLSLLPSTASGGARAAPCAGNAEVLVRRESGRLSYRLPQAEGPS